jgi:hypothetical protein
MFADLEYDHLDYSRPGSSWKPHYQRMANGFSPHLKDATSKDCADSADWCFAKRKFLLAGNACSEVGANVQNFETDRFILTGPMWQ